MPPELVLINFSLPDVDGIKYVINYDYPNSSEDYIHRIGRTGRSDTTGTSYAFFTPTNFRQAKDLVSVLKEANQVRKSLIFQNNCLQNSTTYFMIECFILRLEKLINY